MDINRMFDYIGSNEHIKLLYFNNLHHLKKVIKSDKDTIVEYISGVISIISKIECKDVHIVDERRILSHPYTDTHNILFLLIIYSDINKNFISVKSIYDHAIYSELKLIHDTDEYKKIKKICHNSLNIITKIYNIDDYYIYVYFLNYSFNVNYGCARNKNTILKYRYRIMLIEESKRVIKLSRI